MKHDELSRIIIVYDYAFINGGAAKVAIQSAIGLANRGYDVHFFSAVGPVCDELRNSTVKTFCLEMDDINNGSRIRAAKNGIWNRKAGKVFSSFLQDFDCANTIIHIHGLSKALSSSVVKVAHDKHFRLLFTLHDYFTICPNGGFYNYRKQKICTFPPMTASCMVCDCDKRSYTQKLWRVARQIVQDQYIRNNPEIAFISLSDLNERVTMPYLISNCFYRLQNPIQLDASQIPDCSKSNIFLYAGRMSKEKGTDLFCRAVTELKKERNIRGIIVGGGDNEEAMRKQYPDVEFMGWKTSEEVAAYMQLARVIVLPSRWYEAAPLSLLEAYSAALPAIVSDCCSGTELINDGENGFLFHANDVDSLKETMKRTLDDELMSKIQSNIKKSFHPDCYRLDTHVSALLDIYRDWMHRRGDRRDQ